MISSSSVNCVQNPSAELFWLFSNCFYFSIFRIGRVLRHWQTSRWNLKKQKSAQQKSKDKLTFPCFALSPCNTNLHRRIYDNWNCVIFNDDNFSPSPSLQPNPPEQSVKIVWWANVNWLKKKLNSLRRERTTSESLRRQRRGFLHSTFVRDILSSSAQFSPAITPLTSNKAFFRNHFLLSRLLHLFNCSFLMPLSLLFSLSLSSCSLIISFQELQSIFLVWVSRPGGMHCEKLLISLFSLAASKRLRC